MADPQSTKRSSRSPLKLVSIIVLVLLVPIVLDQVEVDREQVRLWGRIAAGAALILFAYGIFTKLLKVLAFVVLALIGAVLLVSEEQIKAPRLKELLSRQPK